MLDFNEHPDLSDRSHTLLFLPSDTTKDFSREERKTGSPDPDGNFLVVPFPSIRDAPTPKVSPVQIRKKVY